MFLPFDLDIAFSAGFVLALISSIHPAPDSVPHSTKATFTILDALVDGGNAPARFRRQEFQRLNEMLCILQEKDSMHSQIISPEQFAIVPGEEFIHGVSPGEVLNVASLLDLCPGVDDATGVGWLWLDEEQDLEQSLARNWDG